MALFPSPGNGEDLDTRVSEKSSLPKLWFIPLLSSQPLDPSISFPSPDTKGLYFQAFGGRRRCLSKSVAPLLAHGYRRFLPTKDHVFILDYVGTLFFFKNALVSSTLGQIQWKRACRYVVLCRGAKDVSSRTLAAQKPPLLREASLEVSSQTRNWKTSPHFPALHPRSSPPTGSTCPSLIPLQGRRSQTPSSFPTVCLGPKM